MSNVIFNKTLWYKEGSSNKVYQVQITEDNGDCSVSAFYGRRGNTLQEAKKTTIPVEKDKAISIAEKLIRGKQAKGYSEDETGAAYVATSNEERVTGLSPQLLNAIDENTVEKLLNDPDWFMMEKFDGVRIMIEKKKTGDVVFSNRKGLSVSISSDLSKAMEKFLPLGAIVDGELIGDHYVMFDCLYLTCDTQSRGCLDRYALLKGWALGTQPSKFWSVAEAWIGCAEKTMTFERIKDERAEGVVFKNMNASYVPGRPASGGNQLKYKFTASATVKVLSRNPDKRSVGLGVLGDRFVGNVTIPPNYGVPCENTIVEVQYLYMFSTGSLYQPVYKGIRVDKTAPDTYESLKFKQGTGNTDEDGS